MSYAVHALYQHKDTGERFSKVLAKSVSPLSLHQLVDFNEDLEEPRRNDNKDDAPCYGFRIDLGNGIYRTIFRVENVETCRMFQENASSILTRVGPTTDEADHAVAVIDRYGRLRIV